jgi:hypothetical protein
MKIFDSTKPKYNHLFKIVTIFINFLHGHRLDFIVEIIGKHIINPVDYN